MKSRSGCSFYETATSLTASAVLVALLLVLGSAADVGSAAYRPFTVVEASRTPNELKAGIATDVYLEIRNGPDRQTLEIPSMTAEPVTLELERFDIIAPDARFLIGSPGGEIETDRPEVVVLRGAAANDPESRAFVAISSNGMINGYVDGPNSPQLAFSTLKEDRRSGNGVLTVRPITGFGGLEVPFCGTEYDASLLPQIDKPFKANPPSAEGPLLQRVAIDADQAFVDLFGSAVEAQDYIVQLMAAVSDIYIRDNNIRMTLAAARVWPSGGEPFNAYDLSGFRQHWWNNEDTSGLNIVHLFSGVRDAPYGGVAFLATTCSGYAYGIDAYMNGTFLSPVDYPDNGNWDLNLVAHEMGHNHGTGHTHDDPNLVPLIDECGNGIYTRGTIMSYCHTSQGYQRNIDLRFHRRIQEIIQLNAGSAACHPYDCNGNNVDDSIDIAMAVSPDTNGDGIPDECQDCNNNGTLDPQDIALGAPDVDGNGILDECEADCNGNNYPDNAETWNYLANDDDGNNIPDECDPDCNGNFILDYSEIQADMSLDIDRDRVLDECQDCNGNFVWDWYDIGRPYSLFVANEGTGQVREFHGLSGVLAHQIGSFPITLPQYVVSSSNGQFVYITDAIGVVIRLDVATLAVTTLVAGGSGGLGNPTGITLDGAGNLYVADNTNSVVKRYSATGTYLGDFVTAGSPLNGPDGLEFGPNGNLFVTSSDDAVYEYNGTTGAYVGPFVSPGSGGLSGPRDLAFLDNGNMLVTSFNSNEVLEYAAGTGAYVKLFSDEYGWTKPWGITKGFNGNIFLTGDNGGQYRVFEYFQTGIYFRSFVRGSGFLSQARGLCFLPGSPNDLNENWIPDSCEPGDMDGDGIANVDDNCPTIANSSQDDGDGDGAGDACDNCPSPNPDQRDVDNDGVGDICDNCPAHANAGQADGDGDGRGDECDNCPGLSNPTQADTDGDFIGDLCDICPNDFSNDADGDSICGSLDNCPTVYNPDQTDVNGNGIGDVCEAEVYDTVATACTQLAVSSMGNFGNTGEFGASLDYGFQGDCEFLYLYDGSPMVGRNTGSDTTLSYRLYDSQHFKMKPGGKFSTPTADSGDYEIFESASFMTEDTTLAIEKTWYAPKHADTCNFVIQCMRLYSADGGTHSGLAVGEFVDWDIPASSNVNNTGGFIISDKLIYLQGTGFGCQDNTLRQGGQALLGIAVNSDCADTSVTPYGALTQSNSTYIYPNNGPVAGEMFTLMQQSGYTALGSSTDQFALMTFYSNLTINPGDTVEIYSVIASTRTASLSANVAEARQWFADHLQTGCGGVCCNGDGIRGNVDGLTGPAGEVDVADLSYLVDYLFRGGPVPTCEDEANVDGMSGPGGPIDVADLSYLVDYLFRGGPPPPACP